MAKKFLILLIILVAVFIIVSCDASNQATGNLQVILSLENEGSRSILPEGIPLDITNYKVKGVGPDNKEFEVYSDSPVVTVEGLIFGNWTITATGLNENNLELVKGSVIHEIKKNSDPAKIVLNDLIGTGTLQVTLCWPESDVPDPLLEVYLTGPTSENVEIKQVLNTDYENKTANFQKELDSGSYTLRAVLKSGDQVVSGLVEAIRVVQGADLNATLNLNYSTYNNTSETLFLENNAGVPVTGKLTGITQEVNSNSDVTVNFKVDEDFINNDSTNIEWFLDGVSQSDKKNLPEEGDSIVINTNPGSHRLDVIVSNDKLGSTGSITFPFLAKITGEEGRLVKVSKIENGDHDLVLGSQTLINALPGERFLVTTPNENSMQICRVVNNTLSVVKTYGNSDFPWLSDIILIDTDVSDGVVGIYDDNMDNINFTFLKFDSDNNTLALLTENARTQNLEPLEGNYLSSVKQIFFNPAVKHFYVIDPESKIVGAFKYSSNSVGLIGKTDLTDEYSNIKQCCPSKSGLSILSILEDSDKFMFSSTVGSTPIADYKVLGSGLIDPTAVNFTSENSLLIGTDGKMNYYTYLDEGTATNDGTTYDVNPTQIIVSDQYKFVYVLDEGKKAIVTFTIAADNKLIDEGNCPCDSAPIRSVLNGSYLLTKCEDNKLLLCRVIIK